MIRRFFILSLPVCDADIVENSLKAQGFSTVERFLDFKLREAVPFMNSRKTNFSYDPPFSKSK